MTIRLADLEAPLETVVFPGDDREHPVQRFNGVVLDLWQAWEERRAGGDPDTRAMWDIAARLVPTASIEQVRSLTGVQVAAILGIAGGNIDKVMAALKNGDRPEPASDSGPPTPSAPSSSPSPAPPGGVPGT